MKRASTALLFVSLAFGAAAQSTVYKCVDPQGRPIYTNDRSLGRDCVSLSADLPMSSIPAPPARPASAPPPAVAPASAFPRVSPQAQQNRDATRRQILDSELATELSDLDEAREALAAEEARLALEGRSARAQGPAGAPGPVGDGAPSEEERQQRLQPHHDKIELHERNVEALRRELRGLR